MRNFHDDVFELVRIWNHTKNKVLFFACSLDEDVTEIEYGGNKTVDNSSHVLDTREVELTYMTPKQAFLFDVYNAFVGNNPDIKIIIYPGKKSKEPEQKKESVLHKEKEKIVTVSKHVRKEEGKFTTNRSGVGIRTTLLS